MSKQNDYIFKVPDFGGAPSSSTSKSVDELVGVHRELITDLKQQLTDQRGSDGGKVYTVYLLGELRATAATSLLLENIDFKAPFVDPKSAIGRWGMFPAQEALVKIGSPAVNMIVDKLPTEQDGQRRQLMCLVMADVSGAAIAKVILQRALSAEPDAARKANLMDAIGRIDKLPQ